MTSIEEIRKRAERDAKVHGIYLTQDGDLLLDLFKGLKTNEERYGYFSCPCRIASGKFELDLDIICPCDYRDIDVLKYGACYCSLYVDENTHNCVKKVESIPERRPQELQMKALGVGEVKVGISKDMVECSKETNRKLYYCQQCGYVAFREKPPYVCPICQAKREMFEKIVVSQRYNTKPWE
jgi:ferredoxin-thioredoxin reductase catalytic subunit